MKTLFKPGIILSLFLAACGSESDGEDDGGDDGDGGDDVNHEANDCQGTWNLTTTITDGDANCIEPMSGPDTFTTNANGDITNPPEGWTVTTETYDLLPENGFPNGGCQVDIQMIGTSGAVLNFQMVNEGTSAVYGGGNLTVEGTECIQLVTITGTYAP